MFKKLLFIGLLISVLINFNYVLAETPLIVPIKKPSLSEKEIKEKISKNILKPIKKPKKTENIEIKEKKITDVKEIKKAKKLSFKIPKKKPSIAGITKSRSIKISKYYSKKDFNIARKAISEMQKSRWTSSLKIAKKARDKSIYNFIQWRYLSTPGNQASFFDYKLFIERNSNYPRMDKLRSLAEYKLSTSQISPKKIINWFDQNEPITGYGKMILGESYVLTGNKSKGTDLIKEGWITVKLSKNELKFFRKKFKKYLNAEDYIKRADYLAWNGKYWDLRRLTRYLPKDYELLYTARQILISKGYGVDQAIKNVPEKFKNDAGLNYDRLKWRRKKGRVDSSAEILLKIKNDKDYLVMPDKWWKEREIISRALIYKKKYEIAYKISSNHGMTEGSDFAAAEWMSGWISLSFLNDPLTAKDHFQNFYNNVSYPISTSRGAYWLARAYENSGEDPLELFKARFEENPENASYAIEYADKLISNGNTSDAIDVLESTLSYNRENSMIYMTLGKAYNENSDFGDAVDILKDLFDLDRNNFRVAMLISVNSIEIDDFDSAFEWAEKSMKISKNNAESLAHMGNLYYKAMQSCREDAFSRSDKIVASLAYEYFVKAEQKGNSKYYKQKSWLEENEVLFAYSDWFMTDKDIQATGKVSPIVRCYDWVSESLAKQSDW